MAFGNIERVEIIKVSFNLAIVLDRVTQRDKDVFYSLAHQRDRMQVTGPPAAAGDCDIDALLVKLKSLNDLVESKPCVFKAVIHSNLAVEEVLTCPRALLRIRNLADLLLSERPRALLACESVLKIS